MSNNKIVTGNSLEYFKGKLDSTYAKKSEIITDTNQKVKGNGVSFGSNDEINIVGSGATTVTGNATNKTITINSTNTTYGNATTSASGLMSASDKTKLDGIATGANKTVVDTALSSTSTNPVQNKAIYTELSGKANSSHTHDDRYYTESEIDTKLNSKLNTSLKGVANGLAELGSDGKVPSAQLPSYVDDVLEYSSKSAFPATGDAGKIYVDLKENKTYRWGGTEYIEISASLALGETSLTAYRGDRGKIAYDHSQSAHAPSNAEVNQNAFSNVVVGSTTIAADSKTDTLTLVAGSNVTLTPDATNDKVTISATDTKYTHPAGNAASKSSGFYKISTDSTSHINSVTAVTKADITALGIPGSDTNTTYTFANGTNGFTVTPSGGTAQTVTVTPSISNNVTGSGTSGYIAKFNGANTITNGPAFGSATTTYLRNDGTWATPPDTKYTLPTASTSTLGGVKVDGTTITIDNGVISSKGGDVDCGTYTA